MSRKLFTEEEDKLLIEFYSNLTNAELEELFQYKHTRKQIKWRAKALGLKKMKEVTRRAYEKFKPGLWTEEELYILKKYYPTEGAEGVSKRLKRSPDSVRHKSSRMKIFLDYEVFCAKHANGPTNHNEETKRKISLAGKGRKKSKEHREKLGDSHRGNKNWNWKGGKSFLPYPSEFNNHLRKRIKKRDGHQCVLCSGKKRLVIHHIDEDKNNCADENLITLCMACHNTYHFSKDKPQVQLMKEFFLEHAGRTS